MGGSSYWNLGTEKTFEGCHQPTSILFLFSFLLQLLLVSQWSSWMDTVFFFILYLLDAEGAQSRQRQHVLLCYIHCFKLKTLEKQQCRGRLSLKGLLPAERPVPRKELCGHRSPPGVSLARKDGLVTREEAINDTILRPTLSQTIAPPILLLLLFGRV